MAINSSCQDGQDDGGEEAQKQFGEREDCFIHRDHKSWVNGVAWSPISPRIASASNDQTVQVWHTSHGRELFPDNKVVFTYNGHTEWVRSVAWSPDGSRIASGAHDGTIRVWQAI